MTETTRKPLTLVSGETYSATFRRCVSGLEGDWAGDSQGEYRPFVACTWVCRHGGVKTGEAGTPNIDHGTIKITLADGRKLTGTYQADDQTMSVTID